MLSLLTAKILHSHQTYIFICLGEENFETVLVGSLQCHKRSPTFSHKNADLSIYDFLCSVMLACVLWRLDKSQQRKKRTNITKPSCLVFQLYLKDTQIKVSTRPQNLTQHKYKQQFHHIALDEGQLHSLVIRNKILVKFCCSVPQ